MDSATKRECCLLPSNCDFVRNTIAEESGQSSEFMLVVDYTIRLLRAVHFEDLVTINGSETYEFR
jgi:hypothetical protein